MARHVKVAEIRGREIYDSRGNPTVEVDVVTDDGGCFRAAVPSGASTGIYEALELRDGGKIPDGLPLPFPEAASRCMGKGVLRAVENVNKIIAPKLIGMDVTQQAEIDKLMVETLDGTRNDWGWCKGRLGANAILGVSMAICRAGAAAQELPLYEYLAILAKRPVDKFVLPVPSFNVINGGSHAGNRLACQEFMIMPVGASSFREAVTIGAEVYHHLKACIKAKYGQDACNVGDEGGFAPSVQDNNEALDVLMEALKKSGHEGKVVFATDVAASEFYDGKTKLYDLDSKNPNGSAPGMKKTATELIAYYKEWLTKYPLASIEDPFDQDDWEAYSQFLADVGQKTQVVGDDLLVTNPTRVKKATAAKACNALLLKVNQIGSVTEAIQAANMSFMAGWGVMVSHRSGETEDVFIADLAVGLAAGQIKTGAPCRSERLAKYNQLIRIEEELGSLATYAGLQFRQPLGAPKKVVVVGWGPVGHCAIEELLEKAKEPTTITILCDEPYAAYNRVKLTSFFQHRSPEKLAFAGELWCQEKNINLIFGAAESIDKGAKVVKYKTRKGESGSVTYDSLILTTGSKPFVPPLPGLDSKAAGICLYRTIDDCVAIIERAKATKKAAVIGGGLLGLEAAKALYDLGMEAHIVERSPHLMPVQVDTVGGALLKTKVEALGIKVHVGCNPIEVVVSNGEVTGLKVSENGSESILEVGLVCVSTGVRPRDELAKAAGLEMGARGGVRVNEKQQTSDPHIFAAGEVASIKGGMCYGLSAPGREQAKVMVANLTSSGPAEYKGSDLSTKLKLLGVDLASFGAEAAFWFDQQYTSTDAAKVKTMVAEDKAKGTYKKLVFTPAADKLLGGILVGDIDDYAKLLAIAKKGSLTGLTPQQLLDGNIPVDDGGDGTNLAEDDQVCNCHGVPKGVIKKAILDGAETFEDIRKCTKAGTGCGTCISTGPVPKLLAATLQKMGKKVGACPPALPFPVADIEDLCKERCLKTLPAVLGSIGAPGCEKDTAACTPVVQPLLDSLFNGKIKGEGLDYVGQLKALRKDLFAFVDKQNCNPILVRLAWHDSGTFDKNRTEWPDMGGANGSIIYAPEINHGANNGLNKGVNFLKPFKTDYPLVSWADLIQMASAVSIEHAGGPKIPMKYGRVDVAGPEACPEGTSRGTAGNAGLPDAAMPFGCGATDAATHLRNIFHRMGFTDQEIVALSGAHTLGRAFKERSGTVDEGYGEANACPFTKSVGLCPVRHDGKAGVGMPGGKSWTKAWLKFDNSYYKEYAENNKDLLWLPTDRALHEDPEFKKTFVLYKDDQAAFFEGYSAAHKKLSELGSKFEPSEGIFID